MVWKAQKSHGVRSGLYGGCSNGVPQIHFFNPNTEFSSDLILCDFWAFSTMKRELQGKKFQSDQWSAVCFQEVGGAL
jgi:hypothetical protein